MDVRVGVSHAKEIELEMPDGTDGDALAKEIETAIDKGNKVLWLTDRRGRRVGFPVDKVAYVEIGSATEERRVGFGS